MTKMFVRAYTKQVNEAERTLVGIASTEVIDRYGDIVKQDGWILDNFKKNPVMLWAHNYHDLPIAKIVDVNVSDGKLTFKAQFPKPGLNELADKIFELFKDGVLNAFSVGFIPVEYEPNEHGGYTYTKQELLEISAVTVPANQEALAMALKSIGDEVKEAIIIGMSESKTDKISLKHVREMMKKMGYLNEIYKETDKVHVKGAVPSHESEKLDENGSWDATEAVNKVRKWASSDGTGDKDTIDWNKYKWGFAWFDSEDKENFGAYKLPHHTVDANNVLVTVWRGVAAAMAALMGARGGVDIPDSDFDRVYNHLARHYREFDKEPPEKEFVLTVRELNKRLNETELKVNNILSKVESIIKEVEDIMDYITEVEMAKDGNGEVEPEFDEDEADNETKLNGNERSEKEIDGNEIKRMLKEILNEEVDKDE